MEQLEEVMSGIDGVHGAGDICVDQHKIGKIQRRLQDRLVPTRYGTKEAVPVLEKGGRGKAGYNTIFTNDQDAGRSGHGDTGEKVA
jgi:hypothetical protein